VVELELDEEEIPARVVLEGGERFGTQVVDLGTVLQADEGTAPPPRVRQQPVIDEDNPFRLGRRIDPNRPPPGIAPDRVERVLDVVVGPDWSSRIRVVNDPDWRVGDAQVEGSLAPGEQ